MSLLTSILLIVSGITLLIVVLRARPKARIRRLEDWEQEKLEIAANICHAAARDAFDISLDGSLESLDVLDHMIESGWPRTLQPLAVQSAESVADLAEMEADANGVADNAPTETTTAGPNAIADERFVIACYIGQTLNKHLDGEWRVDAEFHKWPYVYFSRADLAVSPFELAERKFAEPNDFQLRETIERLQTDIDRRTNVRATTWHNAGDSAVSFAEPASDTTNEPSDTPPVQHDDQ